MRFQQIGSNQHTIELLRNHDEKMFLVSFVLSLPGHAAPDRENEISDTKIPREGQSDFFPKISDPPSRFTEQNEPFHTLGESRDKFPRGNKLSHETISDGTSERTATSPPTTTPIESSG